MNFFHDQTGKRKQKNKKMNTKIFKKPEKLATKKSPKARLQKKVQLCFFAEANMCFIWKHFFSHASTESFFFISRSRRKKFCVANGSTYVFYQERVVLFVKVNLCFAQKHMFKKHNRALQKGKFFHQNLEKPGVIKKMKI